MYQSVSVTTLNGLDLLSLSKLYIVTSRVCISIMLFTLYPYFIIVSLASMMLSWATTLMILSLHLAVNNSLTI